MGLGRLVPAPPRATQPSAGKYVVRPGDSLTAIADRFGVPLPALARANKLDATRVLLIGTKLVLPATRTTTDASPSEVRGLVDTWAGRYGVDPSLARALAWMESGYQTNLTGRGRLGRDVIIPTAKG
jgi:soluble lytic murein transglycosylase-like protein